MIRLFISRPTPPFADGLTFALEADQARYATTIMRLHINDALLVFNGRDGEWRATLAEAGKKTVTVRLHEQTRPQTPRRGPVLAVAMVKRAALETIIEKATELGVASIDLVLTARSNVSNTNLERLNSIAKEAAEQTERTNVPAVNTIVKFDRWLASNACKFVIFGDEDSTHEGADRQTLPLLDVLRHIDAHASDAIASTAILIGPEGGFDDNERALLRSMPHVHPVNLGPRILRADTAAISALTLVQAILGDWR